MDRMNARTESAEDAQTMQLPAEALEQPASPQPERKVEIEDEEAPMLLIPEEDARKLRDGWKLLQATFVDSPQEAVEKADALVKELLDRVSEGFENERRKLEEQWSRGDQVSTEDMRLALKRYRAVFERLLQA